MASVLDNNLKALKFSYPELYERVQLSLRSGRWVNKAVKRVCDFETGSMSSFYPAEVILLFGFSNGHYAESILKNTQERTFIIIVEENLNIFVQTLIDWPVQAIILAERVKLSVNENGSSAIREHLENYSGFLSFSQIQVLKDPESISLNSGYYEKIERSIRDLKGVAGLNRRTIEYFSEEWNRHILFNLSHIFTCKGVEKLFGKFKGVPAVVVSAGPSLDKNIKWFKHLGSKAVIIAVDSAYKVLVDNDVPVHFVLCIDSQEKNFSHLEEVVKTPGESVLVVNPVTYPAIPDLFNGNILLMTYNNPLINWIEDQAGVFGDTLVGGSVSTSAFDFARKLGCSPVVISGQDLSYEANRGYVTGSWYSRLFEKGIRRDNSMEVLNRQYVYLNGTSKTKNKFGGIVWSNDEMLSWKNWYEAVSLPGCTIDSTEGGVHIEGFACHSLHDTLFSFPGGEFPIKRTITESLGGESSIDTRSLVSGLRTYRSSLSVVAEIAAKGLRCCSEFSRLLKEGDTPEHVAKKRLQMLHSLCSSVLEEKTFIETNQWDISVLLDRVPVRGGKKGEGGLSERLESYKLLFKGVLELSKTRAGYLDKGLEKISSSLDLII